MEYEVHDSLCIICCYAFPQNTGWVSDDNVGQFQAIGKFIQQNGQVFNCNELSLEPPTFLEEHLHLCSECTLALSSCTETGEQVEKMEMEVRRLQKEILKMLRNLKGLLTRHEEQMEVIENKIQCSNDGSLMAHKRTGKGRQKNGTWGKKNVFTFRNGILRVVEELHRWKNSVAFQLISENSDKQLSVKPVKTTTRMEQVLLEPKMEPALEQDSVDTYDEADYQDYSTDAAPAPEKDPLELNDPDSPDYSPEAAEESDSDDSVDEDYVLPGESESCPSPSTTQISLPTRLTRRRFRKFASSTPLQPNPPKKSKYDHSVTKQPPSTKPKKPSWYTQIHKKFNNGKIKGERWLHCVCCPEFRTRNQYHLEQHLRAHEQAYDTATLKPYPCPFCPRSFYHPQYHEFHVLCHENLFTGSCDQCYQAYSPFLLKEHLEEVHGSTIEKIFECASCQHVSSTRLKYYSHLLKHVLENAILACDLCPQTFPLLSLLKQHMMLDHPEAIIPKAQSCPQRKKYNRTVRGRTKPVLISTESIERETEPVVAPEIPILPKPKMVFNVVTSAKSQTPRPSWYTTVRKGTGRSASTTTRIQCISCPFAHKSWAHFEQHLRGHERNIPEQEKNLKCSQCPMTCGLPQMMELHQHQHAGLYRLKCDMCKFPQLVFKLKEHYQLDHKLEKVFECANCSAMQASRESYLWHLFLYHQAEKDTSLNKCDLCAEVYSDREELIEHLEEKHGLCLASDRMKREEKNRSRAKKKRERESDRKFLCTECGKGFKNTYSLKVHVKVIHEPEDRCHVCPKCGKGFKSSANLTGHVKTCGVGKVYQCQFCVKSFKSRQMLEQHLNLHQGTGFTCEQCGLVVGSQKSFERHLKVHEKMKEWLPCEKCDRTFADKERLEKHVRKQHREGRREHRCEICNKVFHKFHYLKIHRNAVHDKNKNIICDICFWATTQPSALFEHMKLRHPVEYELRRKRKPRQAASTVTGTTSGDGNVQEVMDSKNEVADDIKEHVNM